MSMFSRLIGKARRPGRHERRMTQAAGAAAAASAVREACPRHELHADEARARREAAPPGRKPWRRQAGFAVILFGAMAMFLDAARGLSALTW